LENGFVGLNGDGDWSPGNSSLELSWAVSGDIIVALGNTWLGLRCFGAASPEGFSSEVWVLSLGLEWCGLNVLESSLHESTVATAVLLGAVNELLLGERVELASGNEVSTLNGTSGGESPAGSALSLVLNWGDGTLSSPVDGVGEVGGVEENLASLVMLWKSVSVELGLLLGGPGGEVVVGEGEAVLFGVDLLDLGINLGVKGHSEVELLLGSVGETVLVHVGDEVLLELVVVVVLGAEMLHAGKSGSFAEEVHE